jgi:UDP-N-acetylmuramate-alanine ligase
MVSWIRGESSPVTIISGSNIVVAMHGVRILYTHGDSTTSSYSTKILEAETTLAGQVKLVTLKGQVREARQKVSDLLRMGADELRQAPHFLLDLIPEVVVNLEGHL